MLRVDMAACLLHFALSKLRFGFLGPVARQASWRGSGELERSAAHEQDGRRAEKGDSLDVIRSILLVDRGPYGYWTFFRTELQHF